MPTRLRRPHGRASDRRGPSGRGRHEASRDATRVPWPGKRRQRRPTGRARGHGRRTGRHRSCDARSRIDGAPRCLARSSVRHIALGSPGVEAAGDVGRRHGSEHRLVGASLPEPEARAPSGRHAVSGGRRLASGDPLPQCTEVGLDAEDGGDEEQHEERRDHQAEHDGDRHGDQELRLEAGLEQ
jgi:hypothetical protein